MEWQPIETAPKDGTRFLGYWPDVESDLSTPMKTWWGPKCKGESKSGWHSPYEFAFSDQVFSPTHWMPLPEAPA